MTGHFRRAVDRRYSADICNAAMEAGCRPGR